MSPFEERRFHVARVRGIAVLLSTTLILLTPVAALATEVLTPLERQGKAVLAKFCSECHAVGRTGASPNPAAPAFRTIDRRYPLESLRQTLEETLLFSGALDMPGFRFRRTDIRGVIAYLRSIQRD
jgi:cytochrome c